MHRYMHLLFLLIFACSCETAEMVDSTEAATTGPPLEMGACPEPPTPEPVQCPSCEAPPEEKPALPAGFLAEDEFPGRPLKACVDITVRELGESEWMEPVMDWCYHRVHHSSRGDEGHIVKSRVDGSQLHDRDRPTGRWFYDAAVRTGRMDPERCEHHRIDPLDAAHPGGCYVMANDWPFKKPARLSEDRKRRWLEDSHAKEAFGSRGPIDFNALVGYGAIPGCYPFSAFDRNDVSVTALVRRSTRICARWGCKTKWDIKAHWSDSLD